MASENIILYFICIGNHLLNCNQSQLYINLNIFLKHAKRCQARDPHKARNSVTRQLEYFRFKARHVQQAIQPISLPSGPLYSFLTHTLLYMWGERGRDEATSKPPRIARHSRGAWAKLFGVITVRMECIKCC